MSVSLYQYVLNSVCLTRKKGNFNSFSCESTCKLTLAVPSPPHIYTIIKRLFMGKCCTVKKYPMEFTLLTYQINPVVMFKLDI